jgi:aspartate/methionine/tyrosine aminotransferase
MSNAAEFRACRNSPGDKENRFVRNRISSGRVGLLRYAIREIVDLGQRLAEIDPSHRFVAENIGDPIAKGWQVPAFVKEIIVAQVRAADDKVFGYTHSRGRPETRRWIVEYARRFSPSSTLDYEDVLIASGLGAAISALYHMLPHVARVIQPAPSYPTHASMESFSAGAEPLFYRLDPARQWTPDLEHLEAQVVAHPEIGGLLVINPNNPTGAVYDRTTLEGIVAIAERHGLFIVSDEVYFRMVYNGRRHVQITEIAQGRVPLVVLRGLSKDVPWPGGRCGWIEFHGTDLDADYRAYAAAVKKRVMMEVCSVSLPQFILARIYDHPEYEAWLDRNNRELEANGNQIAAVLEAVPGLRVNRTDGAFYMMPLFQEGILNESQRLPVKNRTARALIESEVSAPGFPLDKRFAYYLLAATGICVVPASGFFSPCPGFRLTTLERDESRRRDTYARLAQAVRDYLDSAPTS